MPDLRRSPRSRLQPLAVAISIISLAGVAVWASQQRAPELPEGASAWLLVLVGLGLYGAATVLRAERWLALLRRGGSYPDRRECYGLTAVGFMGNTVLPLRGGDGMRVVYMSQHAGIGLRHSTGILIAERGLDTIVLLTIYAVLAYGLLSGISVPGLGQFETAAIAAGVTAIAIAVAVAVLRRLGRVERARELLAPLLRATRQLHGAHGSRMAAMTVAIWIFEAANLMALGHAVGLDPNPLEALYILGIGGVFLLIPSGPGFVGTFDAAVLFGATAIGGSGRLAVSFLLVSRLVIFVPLTLVGAALMLTRYRTGVPRRQPPPEALGRAVGG